MNRDHRASAILTLLTDSERAALWTLAPGEWRTIPPLAETTTLLFGYGTPLIAVMGDYAQPTLFGAAVLDELQRRSEPAS